MAVQNYTQQIINRLQKIIESRFKNQLKLYDYDSFDQHISQVAIVDAGRVNITTWAPDIVVDKFFLQLVLRHPWQKDQNKRQDLLEDIHRLKTIILGSRSDSVTGWYNGYIDSDEGIITEFEEDGESERFWKIDANFSCVISYDHTEFWSEQLLASEDGVPLLSEDGQLIEWE